jgi:nicotinate-nucleotide pyrophosphorylase (carboxylating)
MNWLLVEDIIRRALLEDLGHGDITTELLPGSDRIITGHLVAKMAGVLCGAQVAKRCFEIVEPAAQVTVLLGEGDDLSTGDTLARVHAAALSMLSAERVALNFLQRMSGIATQARRLSKRAAPFGIRIVETRKTTPGLRTLDKYAVRIGGGHNHRFGLDDCVMLKDNHFAVAGIDPEVVVRTVRSAASHTMKVIAEASAPAMVEPLVRGGADVILLDNFTPEQVRAAVAQIGGRALIEVSGGIGEHNLDSYLIDGVHAISVGALTHSFRALDISLEV